MKKRENLNEELRQAIERDDANEERRERNRRERLRQLDGSQSQKSGTTTNKQP